MIGAAAAYVSGLFFASFFFDKLGIFMLLSAISAVVVYGRLKRFKAVDYIIIALFFSAAVSVNRCYTHFVYDKITAYAQTEGSFRGEITDYSVYDGNYASYTLKGSINAECKAKISVFTNVLDADCGDYVEIDGCEFSLPESDYLFDGIGYGKSRHVYLEAAKISGISVTKRNAAPIRRAISHFREEISSKILIGMSKETGAVLTGMLFGDKQYIGNAVSSDLYRIGIGHILAVSGLHVSVAAAALMALLKRLRVNKYLRFAAVNVVILLVAAMADYPVSALRAAIMLDMIYSAELFGEQNDSLNSICTAALLISVCDCYALYSAGFVLSFCGTFGIAVFAPYMAGKARSATKLGRLRNDFISAVCVSLTVMPASVRYFDEASLISPLSNIILVPLCVISMLTGFIFIFTGGAFTFLLYPAEILLSAVIAVSDWLSDVTFLTLPRSDEMLSVAVILGAALILAVYLFSGRKKTVAAVLAALMLISLPAYGIYSEVRANRLTIAVLGKARTAAVVISCGGECVVVDLCGNNEQYVEKYLTQKGMRSNFKLLLTENHNRGEAAYLDIFKSFDIYYCDDERAELANERFTADYFNGILTVKAEECKVVFIPNEVDEVADGELIVYYGKASSADLNDDCIVISENGNNFEIFPMGDKRYKTGTL